MSGELFDDVGEMPLQLCCVHEFSAALFLRLCCALSPRRFRNVNLEQRQNKRLYVAIMTLPSSVYYDPEASVALLQVLLQLEALCQNCKAQWKCRPVKWGFHKGLNNIFVWAIFCYT